MKCKHCKCLIRDGDPHFRTDKILCWECAFINGNISEKDFLRCSGIHLDSARAEVHNGKIYIYLTKKAPFRRTNTDYRHTAEYTRWRKFVFDRDGYTCMKCKKIGGKLEAHHIKTFKNHPEVRFSVENGITYCRPCHRSEHRKVK